MLGRVVALPGHEEIVHLASRVSGYPVGKYEVLRVARLWGMRPELIAVARRLPSGVLVVSRVMLVGLLEDICTKTRRSREIT